jgi:tryptophan synthase alpha chain
MARQPNRRLPAREVATYLWRIEMGNRIDQTFGHLRARNAAAFIPYICAGDPTLSATVEIALALSRAGADVLELGVPFSDPLADGIVNQLAAQRALEAGATTKGVLQVVAEIRARSQVPIVLYSYLNPILQFGWDPFHRSAAEAGVDGLLILDLPPEEDCGPLPDDNILHIRLIAPTTSDERKQAIARVARGFIYYVSRTGVTGGRQKVASSLGEEVAAIRRLTDLPVAVGFGISTPEQAAQVAELAHGVVVGSAIVQKVAECGKMEDMAEHIERFVRPFVQAVKAAS